MGRASGRCRWCKESGQCTKECPRPREAADVRLGKRLAYLLRYGAEKEGLLVQEGGYVDLLQLLRAPLLTNSRPEDILRVAEESTSSRGTHRFQKKYEHGLVYLRAVYGRRMERKAEHEDSLVPRLLESCLQLVCQKINACDLSNFPDEYILNTILHRLKREKRLNNRTMRCVLGPNIEHLDLTGVYLTEASMRIVGQSCPYLKLLNLHGCGYLLTDHLMEILLKKLPELESLNISWCSHLTDRTLLSLTKHSPNLQHLNTAGIASLSEPAILHLIMHCSNLQHLDIFNNRHITPEGKEAIQTICESRPLTVILETLPGEDPHQVLPIWKTNAF